MREAVPNRTNLALAGLFLVLHAWQFFLLPIFLLPQSPAWLWTLVPLALTSNSLWYLTHESFHNNLHTDARLNEGLGRALCIAFGAPFHVLRFGHLMHHRFNGSLVDRPDIYDPAKTSKAKAWLDYFFTIFGRLYIQELFIFGLFYLGKKRVGSAVRKAYAEIDDAGEAIAAQTEKTFGRGQHVNAVLFDGTLAFLLFVLSAVLYSGYWYVPVVLLVVRGFFVSFANNLPHYGTDTGDPKYGLNLSVPGFMHPLFFHFHHHRLHHHNPTVPWIHLPRLFKEAGESFDMPLWKAALLQLKGPRPLPAADQRGAGKSSSV